MSRKLYEVIKEVYSLIKSRDGIVKTEIAQIVSINLYKTDQILLTLKKEKCITKTNHKYYARKESICDGQ